MTYWVRRLDEVPLVPTDDPDDFDWYPVQHHLRLGAFGANVYGGDAGTELVGEHDERGSDQEELYVVVAGSVCFTRDGEAVEVRALSFVSLPDPAVRRASVALEDGTLVIAIGAPKDSGFSTSRREEHFERVPRAD